jgi:hypothetical protein
MILILIFAEVLGMFCCAWSKASSYLTLFLRSLRSYRCSAHELQGHRRRCLLNDQHDTACLEPNLTRMYSNTRAVPGHSRNE